MGGGVSRCGARPCEGIQMCSHSLGVSSCVCVCVCGGVAHWGGAQILASALGGRPDVAPHTVQMWSTVAGQRPDAALLGMRGAALRLQGATSSGGGGGGDTQGTPP